MHGTPEGRLRPAADAGFRIGRDVGRVDHAERGCKRVAAGEVLPALGRVTLRAIAAAREGFTLGDQFRREAARSRPRDRGDGWPPRQKAKAREPETSESNDRDEQLLEHGVLHRPARSTSRLITPSTVDRRMKTAKELQIDAKSVTVVRRIQFDVAGLMTDSPEIMTYGGISNKKSTQ